MSAGDTILGMLAILAGILAFIYCVSVYGIPGGSKSRGSPNFRILFWGTAIGGWGVAMCFLFTTPPPQNLMTVLTLKHLDIFADIIGIGYGVVAYSLSAIFFGWIAKRRE